MEQRIEVNYPVVLYKEPATKYIEEYKSYALKTVEGILAMARTIIEANRNLAPSDFKIFCDRTELSQSPSTLRKFKIIGERIVTLSEHSSQLPASWTTIYKISQYSDEVIKKMIHENKISKNTKGSDIKNKKGKACVASSQDKSVKTHTLVQNGTKSTYQITARRNDIPEPKDRARLREIIKDLEAMSFEIVKSDSLTQLFEQMN